MFFIGRQRPRRHIDSHTLVCRDNTGRRSALLVTLDRERLLLSQPFGVAVVLTPLQAGRLRSVLRDLIVEAEQPRDRS
jgi:hypothetical protein